VWIVEWDWVHWIKVTENGVLRERNEGKNKKTSDTIQVFSWQFCWRFWVKWWFICVIFKIIFRKNVFINNFDIESEYFLNDAVFKAHGQLMCFQGFIHRLIVNQYWLLDVRVILIAIFFSFYSDFGRDLSWFLSKVSVSISGNSLKKSSGIYSSWLLLIVSSYNFLNYLTTSGIILNLLLFRESVRGSVKSWRAAGSSLMFWP